MMYCNEEPCPYLRTCRVCPEDDFDMDEMTICKHPDAHNPDATDDINVIGFDDEDDYYLTPEWCPRKGRNYS